MNSVPPTVPHHNTPLLIQRISNDLSALMRTGSFPGRDATLNRIRLEVEKFKLVYDLDALQGHHRDQDFDEPVPPAVRTYPGITELRQELAAIGGGKRKTGSAIYRQDHGSAGKASM